MTLVDVTVCETEFSLAVLLVIGPLSLVDVSVEGNEATLARESTGGPVAFVDVSDRIDHSTPSFLLFALPLPQVDVPLQIPMFLAIFAGTALAFRLIEGKLTKLNPILLYFFFDTRLNELRKEGVFVQKPNYFNFLRFDNSGFLYEFCFAAQTVHGALFF